MNTKKIVDGLTIGFALFAMFFGAGNLILPPFIGLLAGEDWSFSILGFSLTAILAPFMGILAVVMSGNSFTDLGNRIHKTFAVILATAIMLSIGPLVAIPRTAATTFEVGVVSLDPDFSPVLTSFLFFAVVMVLSISPSRVVDIIGKFLTPALLVLLMILVISGIVTPLDTVALGRVSESSAFVDGFVEGYQTMDVLASVIFAGVIITAVISKGYTDTKQKIQLTIGAGMVAALFLLFIYGGLVYLGATSGYPVSEQIKRTDLLLYISNGVLGKTGTIALALCIALACLTTAIALICAMGTFFSQLTRGFLSYKLIVVLTCISSGILAINGVDEIIAYAAPFLGVIYPITFTVVLYMVVFGKRVKRKAPFVAAVVVSSFISIMEFVEYLLHSHTDSVFLKGIKTIKSVIPFSKYELTWLIPSLLAFLLVWFFCKYDQNKNGKTASQFLED